MTGNKQGFFCALSMMCPDRPTPPPPPPPPRPPPLCWGCFVTVSSFFNHLTFNCFRMSAPKTPMAPGRCALADSHTRALWSGACLACYRKCLLAATLGSLAWSPSHSVIISLAGISSARTVICSCLRGKSWTCRKVADGRKAYMMMFSKGRRGGAAGGGLLCRESSGKLLPLQSCPSFSSSKSAPVLIDLLMAVFNGWKAAGTSGFYYWPIKT